MNFRRSREKFYASALLSAVYEAIDLVEIDLPLRLGIIPFDEFPLEQKMAAWLYVFDAMTNPAIPAPELTAVIEGVAFTPFAFVMEKITLELKLESDEENSEMKAEHRYYWRSQVLEAYQELYNPDIPDVSLECTDQE